MKKTLLRFCTVVFLMILTAFPVWAAEQDTFVSLPVTQTVTSYGSERSSESVTGYYTLTADDKTSPMPVGTENGVYQFSITGSNTYIIPNITVTETGLWSYKLITQSDSGELSSTVNIILYSAYSGESLNTMFVAELPNGEKCDLTFEINVRGIILPDDIPENESKDSESFDDNSSVESRKLENNPTPTNLVNSSTNIVKALKTGDCSRTSMYLTLFIVSLIFVILLTRRVILNINKTL